MLCLPFSRKPQLNASLGKNQSSLTPSISEPSVFKPILFTIEQTLVRKTLGRLGEEDQKTLQRVLAQILPQRSAKG